MSEDHFLCSICLDVFSDPVSTPCGHNFCKACIAQHWDFDSRCQCPMCKEMFYPKPDLQVNTLLSDLAEEFRRSADIPKQNAADPEEAPPDANLRTRWKSQSLWVALGCLFIVFAYMTPSHPQKEEGDEKLLKMEGEIDQKLQQIQLKIKEINVSVERRKAEAGRQEAEGLQVFTALKESVEKNQAEFVETIRKRQKTTEEQAGSFIKELEQLIQELKVMRSEVQLLSAAHLKEALADEIKKEIPKLLIKAELKRSQLYAVDVTFDPDTVHPWLILSDDGKQVRYGDDLRNLPETPQRFSYCTSVLGRQGFSSGRFYFEVQVKGKTDWDLGVARESIGRKGKIILTPQNGYWTIWLREGSDYKAHAGPSVNLPLHSGPEKVGVFVDYEEGLVSFYDVDAAALIYSFTGCSFAEKLHPFFSPGPPQGGKNKNPLVITSVSALD